MRIDPVVLLTIVGMASVTILIRVGGLWLMERFTISRKVETWLAYIPGTVLIAIVAPNILTSGVAGVAGGSAAALAAMRTRSPLVAMVVGVGVVVAVRAVISR